MFILRILFKFIVCFGIIFIGIGIIGCITH